MPRIAPDGYDVFVLALDDGPDTFVNTGTAGTDANFTAYGNPISGVPGLLGDALYIPGSLISTNRDGAGGGILTSVTPNISISGWVYIRRYSGFTELFGKQYFNEGWSTPWLTIGIEFNSGTSGSFSVYVATAGTPRQLSISGNNCIPQSRWSHVGATWNGSTSTTTAYVNGTVVGTQTFTGTIDYNGFGGQWFTGGIPNTTAGNDCSMIVQDVRVANIVRPQSYFANIYFNGFQP